MIDHTEINTLLNIIYHHPRERVPLERKTYEKYLSRVSVPPVRTIRDLKGDITVVVVDRDKAVTYLKERYGFHANEDVAAVIQEEFNASNSDS